MPEYKRAIHHLREGTTTMSMDRFPIGLEMDVSYPNFQVSLTLLSTTQLRFEIKERPFARTEIVGIAKLRSVREP